MSSVLAGVDAGGTRTRVLLVDSVRGEVGRGEGGPGLVDPRQPDVAARGIAELVAEVAGAHGIDLPVAALWAGVAGAGREETRSALERALRSRTLAERVAVGTDAEAALRGALPRGPGILLLSGTGSIALGRTVAGEVVRVGGWGATLGDEGSGYRLALAGLRAVVRAADGRAPATSLTDDLLGALELSEPSALIPWLSGAMKGTVAALAPTVVRAGESGDAVARSVVAEAVEALLGHVDTVARRLDADRPPVALAGGMLEREPGFLGREVRDALEARGYPVLGGSPDPVSGAVALARELMDPAPPGPAAGS